MTDRLLYARLRLADARNESATLATRYDAAIAAIALIANERFGEPDFARFWTSGDICEDAGPELAAWPEHRYDAPSTVTLLDVERMVRIASSLLEDGR